MIARPRWCDKISMSTGSAGRSAGSGRFQNHERYLFVMFLIEPDAAFFELARLQLSMGIALSSVGVVSYLSMPHLIDRTPA